MGLANRIPVTAGGVTVDFIETAVVAVKRLQVNRRSVTSEQLLGLLITQNTEKKFICINSVTATTKGGSKSVTADILRYWVVCSYTSCGTGHQDVRLGVNL